LAQWDFWELVRIHFSGKAPFCSDCIRFAPFVDALRS
jgi:hypothetical protein